jgi:hypothetical protein
VRLRRGRQVVKFSNSKAFCYKPNRRKAANPLRFSTESVSSDHSTELSADLPIIAANGGFGGHNRTLPGPTAVTGRPGLTAT